MDVVGDKIGDVRQGDISAGVGVGSGIRGISDPFSGGCEPTRKWCDDGSDDDGDDDGVVDM